MQHLAMLFIPQKAVLLYKITSYAHRFTYIFRLFLLILQNNNILTLHSLPYKEEMHWLCKKKNL